MASLTGGSMSPISSGFQTALNGIQHGLKTVNNSAQVISSISASSVNTEYGTDKSSSNETLTSAVLQMNSAEIQIEASSKFLAVQDRVLGTLLDEMV